MQCVCTPPVSHKNRGEVWSLFSSALHFNHVRLWSLVIGCCGAPPHWPVVSSRVLFIVTPTGFVHGTLIRKVDARMTDCKPLHIKASAKWRVLSVPHLSTISIGL